MTLRSGMATLSSHFFSPLPSHFSHVSRYKFGVRMPPLPAPTEAQCCRRLRIRFWDTPRSPLFRAVSHLPARPRNVCLESPPGLGLGSRMVLGDTVVWKRPSLCLSLGETVYLGPE